MLLLALLALNAACHTSPKGTKTNTMQDTIHLNEDTAIFAGGCFWCTESVFTELKGVIRVEPGYTGGHTTDPDYEQVCSGTTGHAEAIRVIYDPSIVPYDLLLEVFWKTHDPTTLNRQGADVGTQYRSAIFYTTPQQKQLADAYKSRLNAQKVFNQPIVTEISEAGTFYPAEKYHHEYYAKNPNAGYCQFVIVPKLEKFRKIFHEKLK